ncbi:MAG: hypothetical protein ACKV2U_28420 [Bryobacteraceae bacterium]
MSHTTLFSLLALLLSVAPLSAQRSPDSAVGIYHWGGKKSRSVSQGVEEIAGLGGRIVRIALSARNRADYNMGGGCIESFNLAKAVREDSDLRQALGHPKIDVVIITAFDGIGYPDCSTPWHMVSSFYTSERIEAMEKEYSDFVVALFDLYRGKRFILTNRESDNAIYCGSVHFYISSSSFRENCDSQYPALYGGNHSTADSFQALRLWMEVRWRGILDGKRRAADAGHSGVEVFLALEFNAVQALKERGLPSVLHNLTRNVVFDYLSYSAYESINNREPDRRLVADLDEIRAISGSSHIIIGETGFARSVWGSESTVRTAKVQEAALRWGVPFLIHWNLYDQDTGSDYGLFDQENVLTSLGEHYRSIFSRVNQ